MASPGAAAERRLPHSRWWGKAAWSGTLVVVVALIGMFGRAGVDVANESERTALELAETNLRNLVWLEAQRVLAGEGPKGLRALEGQDPRQWGASGGSPVAPGLPPYDAEAVAAGLRERWRFDRARGELVYRAEWLPGGERRWRVELVLDAADSPTPGLARDLRLVSRPPHGDP